MTAKTIKAPATPVETDGAGKIKAGEGAPYRFARDSVTAGAHGKAIAEAVFPKRALADSAVKRLRAALSPDQSAQVRVFKRSIGPDPDDTSRRPVSRGQVNVYVLNGADPAPILVAWEAARARPLATVQERTDSTCDWYGASAGRSVRRALSEAKPGSVVNVTRSLRRLESAAVATIRARGALTAPAVKAPEGRKSGKGKGTAVKAPSAPAPAPAEIKATA